MRDGGPRVGLEGTWLAGHRSIADRVRAEASPGDALAVTEAGVVPFYAGLRTIDMLGLNDREVARTWRRGEGAGEVRVARRVLAQQPRWIVLDGHFDADGAFVPRHRIGRALLAEPGWSRYAALHTAIVHSADWSADGVPRVDVLFRRAPKTAERRAPKTAERRAPKTTERRAEDG